MSGRPTAVRVAGNRRPRLADHAPARSMVRWLLASTVWTVSRGAGFVLGALALVLAALGVFRSPSEHSAEQLLALSGLSAVLLVRLFERLQRDQVERRKHSTADLELGLLFIAAAFVLIELTGGPAGFLYPLIYALVAFLVAYHTRLQAALFLAVILGTELAITALSPGGPAWTLFVSHASFVLLFGFLYSMFLRSEVVSARQELEHSIRSRLARIAQEAESFRLTSGRRRDSRELSTDEIKLRRQVSSVQAIHESLYNVLAVAERALTPHTVALLWLDDDDKHLVIRELRSSSDALIEAPLSAGEGVLGAICKRREPLVLTGLKVGYGGLVYYSRAEPVTDFVGIPVLEGEHLRGVLVADRTDGRPFDARDVEVVSTIATEIVRAVQVERIFSDMDDDKFQREQFYQASSDFNEARTVGAVAKVAAEAAARIAQAELVAVAVATDQPGSLTLESCLWEGREADAGKLVGLTIQAEGGLVGAAIKARHPLPHGTARAATQPVFDASVNVAIEHVKVLPLLWKGQGVGALVLGSRRPEFLSHYALDMLRVVADHAAIAIANAQMYDRMEKMATTDGLTGLTNHRTFQQLFDAHLVGSERYGRKLSLILLDIDHFKTVNDTYGHPVGDMVLKRVARVLAECARKTDVVARYGGEEFAIIMEQTNRDGAALFAERLRKLVEAEEFRCEVGKFRCTLSLGVACFPDDASAKAKLTELADGALYEAKRGGRNRVVTAGGARR